MTEPPKTSICPSCNQKYCSRFSLRRHIVSVHPLESITLLKSLLNHCSSAHATQQCPLCDFGCNSTKDILLHFETSHEISLKRFRKRFPSLEDFQKWKDRFQQNTCSRFNQAYCKTSGSGIVALHRCHRTGARKSQSTGKRQLRRKGSCKINGYCPASIQVSTEPDGSCTAIIMPTHVGHDNDVEHMPLTDKQRKYLAAKIAANVPYELIIEEMRDKAKGGKQKRIHSLTKKDLYNIKRAFNLNPSAGNEDNDASSVESWVHQMKDDCILYYKARDTLSEEHPQLKPDDFVLIIMNGSQVDMLQRFGQDCVCLDRTHGSDQYEFEMHTLLVIDEMKQGFPCAFLISNRSDKTVLKIFLRRVKHQTGAISTRVFMSDTHESYFSAWVHIMGAPELRLYSSWHIDYAWRKNLFKVRSNEKQIATYQQLRHIMEQSDPYTFEIDLIEFVNAISNDPDTETFADYFKEHHLDKCDGWAYCHRPESLLHANQHLEQVHENINGIYLQRKQLKHLNKCLYSIWKFLRNNSFDETVNVDEDETNKLEDIQQSHSVSLKLETRHVTENGNVWEVPSSSRDNFETYRVEELTQTACDCELVCSECGICVHRYSCSCVDYSSKLNMCKHIHLVHRYRTMKENDDGVDNGVSVECQEEDNDAQIEYMDEDSTVEEVTDEHGYARVDFEAAKNFERDKERIIDYIRKIDCPSKLAVVKKMLVSLSSTSELSHD